MSTSDHASVSVGGDAPMVLVTGVAGFIGCRTALELTSLGYRVIGIDNLNDYYSTQLKRDRLALLAGRPNFEFRQVDAAHSASLDSIFESANIDWVVHLAAQAGIRHSISHPNDYFSANLVGFGNILESCRRYRVSHLVYASSSSVYGLGSASPLSEHAGADHPISLYAATKRANELMAHSYSHLYRLPTTGLRLFTVYGPWGRPDMAPMLFADAILSGKPIRVFNKGLMKRDFTYIDDVAHSIVSALFHPSTPNPDWDPLAPDPATSTAPFRIYNVGNHEPIELLTFIEILESALGAKAERCYEEMQPGDILETFASVDDLARDFGSQPMTPIEEGVRRFVEWYRTYQAKPSR